jgi:hypothetical protein
VNLGEVYYRVIQIAGPDAFGRKAGARPCATVDGEANLL